MYICIYIYKYEPAGQLALLPPGGDILGEHVTIEGACFVNGGEVEVLALLSPGGDILGEYGTVEGASFVNGSEVKDFS